MAGTVTFKPNSGTGYDFEEKYDPVMTKSEWGFDQLTVAMWGAEPGLATYLATLDVGDTRTYSGSTWYLTSWTHDSDNVYPTVTLTYTGLWDGLPVRRANSELIDMQGTFSCTTPSEATMTYQYYTPQTRYEYIATSRPAAATYTDALPDIDPFIYKSVVYNADGTRLLGSVDAGLLTALTPVGYDDRVTMTAQEIIGTPWFLCTDIVTRLLPGN